jgi:hypothetical protein
MRRLLLASLFTVGCAPHLAPTGSYCAPPVRAAWTIVEDPAPPPDVGRVERLAAILGLRDVVRERRKAEGPLPVELRLRAFERIEMAQAAIDATSAELDCESERADQAAEYLTRSGAGHVQRLTIASVVVAAGTSIAGVLLSTNNARAGVQDAVAISGGALTAALGIGSLYVHPTIQFMHPHNVLDDVWRGPTVSAMYPVPVWAYLSRPEFSNDQKQPIREHIVARWRTFETLKNDPSTIALLFGAGGKYDAESLHARAAMLDQVQAEVNLENQDLAALAAEILR